MVPGRPGRRADRRRAPVGDAESLGDTLKPGGHLYLPTGTIQDERTILEKARELFGERMQAVSSETSRSRTSWANRERRG